MNRLRWLTLALILFLPGMLRADEPDVRREISFPDVAGYRILACDLHMHTVFSDGDVWPTVRVKEAWRQGLHALAITDHIEYQPHKQDLPTNHNRPFELAAGAASGHNILLVKGAEITRDTPPGHFNALFLKDVKPLETKDLLDVIRNAHEQGAFVVWNHHNWHGPEKGRWLDVHTTLYENKWLQGMEICNGDDYYPDAHTWCLDKKLTMLGASDIHAPDLRRKSASGEHRTMTLVLVKERTAAGLKEALLAGRTVVWCKEQLIGQEEWLRPLFDSCVQIAKPHFRTKRAIFVEVRNVGQADIHLEREGKTGPVRLTLPAHSTSLLQIGAADTTRPVQQKYVAANFIVAPKRSLEVTLTIPGP
jgi:hypothetical protein